MGTIQIRRRDDQDLKVSHLYFPPSTSPRLVAIRHVMGHFGKSVNHF